MMLDVRQRMVDLTTAAITVSDRSRRRGRHGAALTLAFVVITALMMPGSRSHAADAEIRIQRTVRFQASEVAARCAGERGKRTANENFSIGHDPHHVHRAGGDQIKSCVQTAVWVDTDQVNRGVVDRKRAGEQ